MSSSLRRELEAELGSLVELELAAEAEMDQSFDEFGVVGVSRGSGALDVSILKRGGVAAQ